MYATRMSRSWDGKVLIGARRYRIDATRALVKRARRVVAARNVTGLPEL